MGERGYRLSGGERQRLTIARLLLAHPRVVILDEATAHLDSTSEVAVQAALGEALAGRTAVVIAHRLSTIRAADLILVVEGGRIVERGTPRGAAGGRRPVRRALPDPVPAVGGGRTRGVTAGSGSAGNGQGESDGKRRVAGLALHLDPAVMRLHYRGDDRKSQAGAAAVGGSGSAYPAHIGPGEPLEDPVSDLRWDAGAVVVTVITADPFATATPASTWVPGGVWVRALASRLVTT